MASNVSTHDLNDRIKRLSGLVQVTQPDLRITLDQLASDYGVTKARMSSKLTQLGDAVPRPERGAGRQHFYPALATYKVLLEDVERDIRARGEQQGKLSSIMGGTPSANASDDLSPKEIRELVRAGSEMWDMAKEQGRYVPRTEVDELLTGVFTIFAGAVLGLRARVDPNGQLPPAHAQALEDFSRQVLADVHKQVSEFLDDDADVRPEPAAPAGRRATGPVQRQASGSRSGRSSAAA